MSGTRKQVGNEHGSPHRKAHRRAVIGVCFSHVSNNAKRALLHLCLVLLLLPTPSLAITEAQFIDKVLAQDKLLEEAQIGLDIKRIERDASRDNYVNWKANLSWDVGYRYRDLDRDIYTTYDYTSQTRDYPKTVGVAVEKRFLSHPGSLRMGISRSKDKGTEERNDSPTKSQRERNIDDRTTYHHVKEYKTRHYIQFNYPLLKHDTNALSLKTHRRDIVDLKRQQLSFYETKEDFLDARLSDYLSWMRYQRRVIINRELLDKLRRLHPDGEAETALLKSTVYQIERYQSDAGIQLQAIKEKLSVLLDDAAILTETPEYELHKRIDFIRGDLPDYLTTHNRELQRIALSMELNKIEIAHYKNQNLPELDLILRAEENSNQGHTRTSKINDDRTNYTATLEFSYPLGGNIANKANLKKFQLGVRRLEISYQEELQDIVADIQRLHTLLTLDEAQLLEAINAAAQSARIEFENYQSGETSFRDLLQAFQDERTAKLNHIDNVIDYQLNSIDYDNLLDRIIETPCGVGLSGC